MNTSPAHALHYYLTECVYEVVLESQLPRKIVLMRSSEQFCGEADFLKLPSSYVMCDTFSGLWPSHQKSTSGEEVNVEEGKKRDEHLACEPPKALCGGISKSIF